MTPVTPIVRACVPLRLGLAGGGTDISPYCDTFGGAVVNVTIDRYAYAMIEPSLDGRVHLIAQDQGRSESFTPEIADILRSRLALHAGVVARMARAFGGGQVAPMRVSTFVDAPAGSGLGSSSALVVALVEAFRTYLGLKLDRASLAHMAFEIERIDLALAGGKQDHYAAAFGGANYIEFLADNRAAVTKLPVPEGVLAEMELSTVICFTGISRQSAEIIEAHLRRLQAPDGPLDDLHQLKQDAADMRAALLQGRMAEVATILDRSWTAKQRIAPGVTTPRIEALYRCGIAAGAVGGKVSGAGGGGFMMFMTPPSRRLGLIAALNGAGGEATGVRFTSRGAVSWAPGSFLPAL